MKEGETHPVEITIMGQRLSLRIDSEHNEEYVRKVAGYVENKMREIEGRIGSGSSIKIAMYAALYIANDYFEVIDKNRQSLEDMLGRSRKIISFINERLD
ncbi:MAG: cell division protein ZapA [Oligoflexia bacterium]|nr:cell division protein ZapA [Oligoflexia bacterium]